MRLASALKADLLFQYRHGFYAVYAIVSLLYILILRNIPANTVSTASVFVILSDTSVLGFFFIGGILILERGQGILNALFITPLKIWEYLFSKTVSLSLLALAASLMIIVVGTGRVNNLLPFGAGVLLTSSLFTLLGSSIASRSASVNSYFGNAMVYLLPTFLPLLGFFGIYETPFWMIIPSQPVITLTLSVFGEISTAEIALSLFVLVVWNAIAAFTAHKFFSSSLSGKL